MEVQSPEILLSLIFGQNDKVTGTVGFEKRCKGDIWKIYSWKMIRSFRPGFYYKQCLSQHLKNSELFSLYLLIFYSEDKDFWFIFLNKRGFSKIFGEIAKTNICDRLPLLLDKFSSTQSNFCYILF